MAAGLASFIKYIGHSNFVIKSIVTGERGAQEGHFQAIRINRAEDYIALRNGKRQLWINLQKLKPAIGDYISFGDVDCYKNIYIDLDCIKPDGFKDYAATEEERAAALSQLPILAAWLESHGMRHGLELHTGNGAGMVLPIPETKAEPVFIAKLATFLKKVQADLPCTDPAMFDPPRVIGIPGTINAKLETEGRKNQVRKIVGNIPERVEDPALLDFIKSCEPDPKVLKEYLEKCNTPFEQPPQTTEKPNSLSKNADSVIEKLNSLLSYHAGLKDLLSGKIDRFDGDRSRAEYSVCGSLINAGFADPEIDYIMQNVSKIGKWQEEDEHYRFEMTLGKLRAAEAAKGGPVGPTVLTAFQKLIENEDKITGSCLWDWRMEKPRIQVAIKSGYLSRKGEEKAHKLLKKFEKILEGLGIDYDDLHPILLKPKSNKEEFSEEIKANALAILKTGDPVKFIVDSCSETVEGAETAIKKLLCCISVQNIKQSSGLHPKLNGDSSGGKTFTVYTFAHHMPTEAVIKGSMSAKAGFYHNDGNRVFRILDDYQAGNEDLDTVIKQTSSEFHAPYQHRTVANHMAMLMEIGAEQTWAITSVDSSQEIQVLNRQLPININDSKDLTQKVNKKTIERYSNGKVQFPLSEKVLVSRCIIQTLRDEGYIDIRIPFGDRINWRDDSNRRNPGLFMDLLVAFTAIYRYQREKDADGYYLANEADFNTAKALFSDKDAEELVKRLTKKERETLDFMLSRPEGITQDELAEQLKVSRQRAGQIIYGQKKDTGGGLMGKLAITETRLSEMIEINDIEKRTVHKTVYSLKEYDRLAGFDAIVRLEPAPAEPCKPCKDGAMDGAREDTTSSKDGAIVESKKEKERGEREGEGLQGSSLDASLSLSEKAKSPCNPCTEAADSEARPCTALAPPLQTVAPTPRGEETPTTAPAPVLEQAPAGKGDTPKLRCAKCGADLTGHGTVETGGKLYCARPGCGYPARAEART